MDENKKNEMNKGLLQEHTVKRDRSLTATGVVIAVIAVLLIFAYYQINRTLRQRSLDRLAEGANTAIEEVTSKLERDSRLLNATAGIISQADNFDIDATLAIMESVNPLLETMNVRVLPPDTTTSTSGWSSR